MSLLKRDSVLSYVKFFVQKDTDYCSSWKKDKIDCSYQLWKYETDEGSMYIFANKDTEQHSSIQFLYTEMLYLLVATIYICCDIGIFIHSHLRIFLSLMVD